MNKLNKIMLAIIIVVLIVTVVIITYNYISLKKSYDEVSQIGNYTHLIVRGRAYGKMNENDTITTIYTFNSKDVVINVRHIVTFEKEKTANEQYALELKDVEHSEAKIIGNVVVFNDKCGTNVTKSQILEAFENSEYELLEY